MAGGAAAQEQREARQEGEARSERWPSAPREGDDEQPAPGPVAREEDREPSSEQDREPSSEPREQKKSGGFAGFMVRIVPIVLGGLLMLFGVGWLCAQMASNAPGGAGLLGAILGPAVVGVIAAGIGVMFSRQSSGDSRRSDGDSGR